MGIRSFLKSFAGSESGVSDLNPLPVVASGQKISMAVEPTREANATPYTVGDVNFGISQGLTVRPK